MANLLLAPLSGALVATGLTYAFVRTVDLRTARLSSALRDSAHDLALQAPEEADEARQARLQKLQPAYIPRSRPTLSEEVKARWNEHLTDFFARASATEWDTVFSDGLVAAQKGWQRLSGSVADAAEQASSQIPTASLREGAATVQRHLPDPRLAQPNTYYMGQGTTLRG